MGKLAKTASPSKQAANSTHEKPALALSAENHGPGGSPPSKNMELLAPLPASVEERPISRWSSSFVQKKPPKDSFIPPTTICEANREQLHRPARRSPAASGRLAEARAKHKSATGRADH